MIYLIVHCNLDKGLLSGCDNSFKSDLEWKETSLMLAYKLLNLLL